MNNDGSTIALGASSTNTGFGAVYVYERPAGGWVSASHTARLTSERRTLSMSFGLSLGMSADGGTIVVGGPGRFSDMYDAVFVFVRPAAGWTDATETARLEASDGMIFDGLGRTVGISADGATIAAGAPSAADRRGAVYVFERGAAWASGTERAKLVATQLNDDELMGLTVAIAADGNTIVAAAPLASTGSLIDHGAAYVFARPGDHWGATPPYDYLKVRGAWAQSQFGIRMALSGDGHLLVLGSVYALPETTGTGVGPAHFFQAASEHVFLSHVAR